jgi:hypothetical protein
MDKDQISSVSSAHIAGSDMIRRALAAPSALLYEVRMDTALCIASDLIGSVSCKAPDAVSDAVRKARASPEWTKMADAVHKNDLMPVLITKTILKEIISSFDNGTDISEGMTSSWNSVRSLIRAMDAVASLCPVFGSVRDAQLELISNPQNHGNIIGRNDDIGYITKVMRSLGTEMIGHKRKFMHSGKRKISVIVDTSESMYGEPEMTAKGLILALTKRMTTDRRDIDVTLFSSGLPVLSPSRGTDVVNMVSFRSGTGEPFADALKMILSDMKDNSVVNTDLILVSKGTGILNDPKFTDQWQSFKTGGNVNVITAVPGGNDACGLTELSDHIVIFDDESMNSEKKEFARLIDILS